MCQSLKMLETLQVDSVELVWLICQILMDLIYLSSVAKWRCQNSYCWHICTIFNQAPPPFLWSNVAMKDVNEGRLTAQNLTTNENKIIKFPISQWKKWKRVNIPDKYTTMVKHNRNTFITPKVKFSNFSHLTFDIFPTINENFPCTNTC